MPYHLRRWIQIALFNLLLVASLGVVMRYKIAFSLPLVNQRFLLQAHSHFAFSGWISQALMSLLVGYLYEKGDKNVFSKYRLLLSANLVTAYGMLLTFPFLGYTFFPIFFSTLSIFTSYIFAIRYWRDINKMPDDNPAHHWFKAALVFNVLSSLGPFSLAYMMASKNIQSQAYLASVYFFLHFQYNGWFFFACMGLLSYQLSKRAIPHDKLKFLYMLFAIACVPAYFLSTLWLHLPVWVYALVVVSVLLQLSGWVYLIWLLKKYLKPLKEGISGLPAYIFLLWMLALTIKLFLQAGSMFPALSKLAFGFRPIVIGYLHLVLLGVITLFLFFYFAMQKLISINKTTVFGIVLFIMGVIFNEVLLMIQGIADLNYTPVSHIDIMLLVAALVLFFAMAIINIGQRFGSPT